jgi:2,4-dienoyl-CoA reductase-like NADH-dependent reductase (Old Yellow Enzyme family)
MGYDMDYLRKVKPVIGNVLLFNVGGIRRIEHMEAIIEKGEADLICLSRPFIKEPDLVKKFMEGSKEAKCQSCNR